MKKAFLLLAIMTGLCYSTYAQLSISQFEINGQNSIKVFSLYSGITPGNKIVRKMRVFDNAAHTATVGAVHDSFVATTGTVYRMDSIHMILPYPLLYRLVDSVSEYDSTGLLVSSAVALNDTGVVITPYHVKVTQSISHIVWDSMNVSFVGVFSSGFCWANLHVDVSYGDTLFGAPVRAFPAFIDTIPPVLGTSVQTVTVNVVVPIGVNNFPASFRVYLTNDLGTDSSVIFKGHTHSAYPAGITDLPVNKCPGTVEVYSPTGQLICIKHVQDMSEVASYKDVVPVNGLYFITERNEAGYIITRDKLSIVK